MSYEAAPNSHHSVSIQLTRDKRLSFRARGIAIRLLSNAPGFRMTAADLARETPSEGRYAVLSAMKELRKYGYAQVIRRQDERGRWNTVTRVYGVPQPECNDCTPVTEVQSPNVGVPNPGQPASGNCTLKSSSTKKVNQKDTTTTPASPLLWDYLPQLSPEQQVVVVEKLKGLDRAQHQDVLDELAGAVRTKAIKGAWPQWLHGVIQKTARGEFQPSLALDIQRDRKQRIEAEQTAVKRRAEAAERDARNADPATKARNKANLKAIEEMLHS